MAWIDPSVRRRLPIGASPPLSLPTRRADWICFGEEGGFR
jgi:hypothetical protein